MGGDSLRLLGVLLRGTARFAASAADPLRKHLGLALWHRVYHSAVMKPRTSLVNDCTSFLCPPCSSMLATIP